MIPALLFVLSTLVASASAINNGLSLTPAMGWNSWNYFECQVNETIVREIADAFISTG
jgi:alpha-galactosidase